MRPSAGGGFNGVGLADLIDAATLGVLLGLGLFAVEPTTEIRAFLPLARGKDRRTSMTIPPGEPTTGVRKEITAARPAFLPATVGTGCVDRGGGAASRLALGLPVTAGKPTAHEDHELRLEY